MLSRYKQPSRWRLATLLIASVLAAVSAFGFTSEVVGAYLIIAGSVIIVCVVVAYVWRSLAVGRTRDGGEHKG